MLTQAWGSQASLEGLSEVASGSNVVPLTVLLTSYNNSFVSHRCRSQEVATRDGGLHSECFTCLQKDEIGHFTVFTFIFLLLFCLSPYVHIMLIHIWLCCLINSTIMSQFVANQSPPPLPLPTISSSLAVESFHFLQELCSQAIVVHVHRKAHEELLRDVFVGTFCRSQTADGVLVRQSETVTAEI